MMTMRVLVNPRWLTLTQIYGRKASTMHDSKDNVDSIVKYDNRDSCRAPRTR